MTERVTLPASQFEDSVEEVEIASWYVEVGDTIEKDAPLVEVLVEKASIEVASPVAGTIKELLAEEGAVVEVGTEVAVIETS